MQRNYHDASGEEEGFGLVWGRCVADDKDAVVVDSVGVGHRDAEFPVAYNQVRISYALNGFDVGSLTEKRQTHCCCQKNDNVFFKSMKKEGMCKCK